MQTALVTEAQKENLPEAEVLALQTSFAPFFQEAENLKAEAMSIVVTSIEQKDMIAAARSMRLKMKAIRTSTENARKTLKEESLRKGRAIDGMANLIKFVIVPIEEHLENQENFVKLQEQKKIEELKAARVAELATFEVDASSYTNLGEMPDDQYRHLVDGAKHVFTLKQEAERKAIAEREQKAKEDEAERERLKAEKAAADAKAAEERKAREVEEKKRKEAEAALEKERASAAAEEKRKKQEEAARIKAEKKAAAAPDKVKLESLAVYIESIAMPLVKSEEAQTIVTRHLLLLADIAHSIRKDSEAL